MNYAEIGSISHGTLRDEDILEAMADTLEELSADDRSTDEENAIDEARELLEVEDEWDESQLESVGWLVNETLPDLLQEYAPPYCYFGAHVGDGSDIGYWPDHDAIAELPNVSDPAELEELPHDTDAAVYVNDHGNMTLYTPRREWSMAWDIV